MSRRHVIHSCIYPKRRGVKKVNTPGYKGGVWKSHIKPPHNHLCVVSCVRTGPGAPKARLAHRHLRHRGTRRLLGAVLRRRCRSSGECWAADWDIPKQRRSFCERSLCPKHESDVKLEMVGKIRRQHPRTAKICNGCAVPCGWCMQLWKELVCLWLHPFKEAEQA